MESFEVTIPLRYLGNVGARVDAANRKLAKRGAAPFVLEELWRGVKNIAPRDDRDSLDIPAVTLRITGEPFKVPGHALVGVFFKGENGEPNRLTGFGGHEFTAEQQNPENRCDHCNAVRDRKVLFLLKEEATGAVKQIGGDCAEIYLGMSPVRAVNTISLFDEAANLLRMMEGEFWDEEDSVGRNSVSAPLTDYLASVAASIRLNTWFSATRAAEFNVQSTAYEAADRLVQGDEILPGDYEMAESAIAHWRALFPIEEPQVLDEFEANLKLIVHSSAVSSKSFGRAAWMVQGYQTAMLRTERSAQAANSVYQGVEGEVIETVLRIDHRSSYESAYGLSFVISMSDAEGNAFIWKTASPPAGLDKGVITSVRAKVKGHSEFRGVKQTNISHMKPEVRFAEFPSSVEEWQDARTQAFLIALSEGWFNKSLAKGIDAARAMNASTPPVLGLLLDRWMCCSGTYQDGAAQAIKDALKAGADPALVADYRLLGEVSLADAMKEHPKLAEAMESPKKPRKRATPSMGM